MEQALAWDRDGRDWPLRESSRFVHAAGLRWHVQTMAPQAPQHRQVPILWLLHGTGASTHSWRDVMPLLARQCQVVAVDLPGHAFTAMPAGGAASPLFSLPGMGQAVLSLMRTIGLMPDLLIGHSAGAALAVRMSLDGLVAPSLLVGVNGALLPLDGLAGRIYSPMARVLAGSALVPRMFAWRASDPRMRERLIAATGSALDPTGQALYGRLMQDPGHAAAALAMMARWDLPALARELPRLQTPLHLCTGASDRTVPPAQAVRVHMLLQPHPLTGVTSLGALGHLAHEERPRVFSERVLALAQDALVPCAAPPARTGKPACVVMAGARRPDTAIAARSSAIRHEINQRRTR